MRAETGGAAQCVLRRRELPGFARVNKVISASLGYPLSAFNKNFTLKEKWPHQTSKKKIQERKKRRRRNVDFFFG